MKYITSLIVMDFQNDFCTVKGIGAEYRGDLSRMQELARNIPLVITKAREIGIEVIFVRFIGDSKYQKPNWVERDHELNKRPKCLEKTWGSDFYKIEPLEIERIFDKHAYFDAFLHPAFGAYLEEKQFNHLVFSGVYCDVCLDSTARSAFQKGYWISVIDDCTTNLHLQKEDSLKFMRKVYGADIISYTDFFNQQSKRLR